MLYVVPAWSGSGSYSPSVSQPRFDGQSPTASVPFESRCQKSSGPATPPGKRQPMPTIAIGSLPPGAAARLAPASTEPAGPAVPLAASGRSRSVSSRSASADGVGWSNRTVAGRASPVTAASRLRSSTAVSDSKPSAENAFPGWTVSTSGWRRTVAAWVRTSSVRVLTRSSWRGSTAICCRRASAESPPSRAADGAVVSWTGLAAAGSGIPWRRAAVHRPLPVVKRLQSTSATTTSSSSSASARPIAATAVSGSITGMPKSRSRAATSSASMPGPAQAPQATDVPGSPAARRAATSASTAALAAA